MPSDPTRPGGPRYTRAQRRLLTAVAGLIVAALAGGAYALTYDVLRELALAGGVASRWAPLYPAMADTLTAMAILSLVITRNARWWTRLLRWVLLLVLVAGGAALSVQHSVWGPSSLPEDGVRAGVAVAPHAMLVIAVWLWLTMFKQIRVARPGAEEMPPAEAQRGHVKVLEPAAPEPPALPGAPDPGPGREPSLAFLDDPEPLIPFPEPDLRQAAHEPDTGETVAHETPEHETFEQETSEHETSEHGPAPHEQPAVEEAAGSTAYEPEPAVEERLGDEADETATDESAPQEHTAYEEFVVEETSPPEPTPAPALDALPEPRPAVEPPTEPPTERPVPAAPRLLPTDVELVRSRGRDGAADERPLASTTRPDMVMPGSYAADDDDHDTPLADRAEDPDAGERPGGRHRGESDEPVQDWNPPPSSSFRSGPTPPVD